MKKGIIIRIEYRLKDIRSLVLYFLIVDKFLVSYTYTYFTSALNIIHSTEMFKIHVSLYIVQAQNTCMTLGVSDTILAHRRGKKTTKREHRCRCSIHTHMHTITYSKHTTT